MNKRLNIWIMMILVVGVLGFAYIEGYAKPKNEEKSIQYEAAQMDPQTHDIRRTARYKNKYMGNAGNLGGLNGTLPYDGRRFTFQLYPDQLKAELIFDEPLNMAEEEAGAFRQKLLYNSTANFVFIDNLQTLQLSFPDAVFSVERGKVSAWYGGDERLIGLQDPGRWREEVQQKLSDPSFADKFYEQIVEIKMKKKR